MKLWLTVLTSWMVGTSIAVGILTGPLDGRVGQLQAQLQQARAELAQVSAKAAGAHRDLITCADLQGLGLETLLDIGLNTDATGALSAVPDQVPVQLPSHCINQ